LDNLETMETSGTQDKTLDNLETLDTSGTQDTEVLLCFVCLTSVSCVPDVSIVSRLNVVLCLSSLCVNRAQQTI
jgi:hypothetical protein